MAKLLKSIGNIGDKMTSRGFLMSALGTSTFSSVPSLVMPFLGGAIAEPMIFGTVASGSVILVSIISSIVVYVKSRRNSRRAIEKSTFGRILTDKERKEHKSEYQNAKLKAKLDKKAEQAQLKAEEETLKKEQAKLKAEAKLLKKQAKQAKKVKKETFRKKAAGLPLKMVLGGVKFLNTFAVEIPKASVPEIPTDAVPDVVQGNILPQTTDPVDVLPSVAELPDQLNEVNEVFPATGLVEAGKPPVSLDPTTQSVPITPITDAPGSTPMPVTPI
ncbi:hypothetical protein TWF481_005260 [Arthrobotrys musiformis]|uniref:Uncharacterized protein n=1 Tax=Arthrobotrys musiformis TaxID=47236 RepID=A0AAV9WFD0_9PEZI